MKELREKIQEIIYKTDWDKFKSQKVLLPSLEIQALLVNAVKKIDKVKE